MADHPRSLFPLLRDGPDVLERMTGVRRHRSTLARWASHGIDGVKLNTLRMGGTIVCREEWLYQFFEELEAARQKIDAARREGLENG